MAAQVHIVGAGFSGLSSAYYLKRAGFHVEVFEQQTRCGGMLFTEKTPWGLAENAANAFVNSPLLEELAGTLKLSLIPAQKKSRKRYILRNNSARRWPLSFGESLKTLVKFCAAGKRSPYANESVADWGQRVLGSAATQWLLAPALQGIYAGDISRMSANLILRRFFIKKRNKKKSKFRGSVSPQHGMGEFVESLQQHLIKQGVLFHLGTEYRHDPKIPLVLGTSMHGAALILKGIHPAVSEQLQKLEMLPLASCTVFYPQSAHKLHGFGCLFPRSEAYEALGVLINEDIFPNRTQEHSETWIYPDCAQRTEHELLERIAIERRRLWKDESKPLGYRIKRWPAALPHYTLELEHFLNGPWSAQLKAKNVYLMGNYLGALGLSNILEEAMSLPERLK